MAALPDRRNALIRLVHVAKRDLKLPDEAYRDLLKRETGKDSCAAMTEGELDKALKALRSNGFRVKHFRDAPKPSRKPHRAREGQRALLTALWIDLWHLGAVEDNSDKALDAFVSRQTGVAHSQWLSPANANLVIEALKAWLEREGFRMPFVPEGSDAGLYAKRELCRVLHRKLKVAGAAVAEFEDDFHHLGILDAAQCQRFADEMGSRLRDVLREAGA